MKTKPLLSVCCIAYNHEPYIRDCIEGFLMQKTNFPIEILIFDDASTDNSQKIINEFAQEDKRIATFLQDDNQWSKGRFGFLDWLFPIAKGKYLALCEGDDYWTDPLKLQKQVDYMETNEDCLYSFHKVNELKDGVVTLDELNPENKSRFSLDDVLLKNYAHTPSIVFRNTDFSKFPAFLASAMPGDHTLQVLLLRNGGYAYFMEDIMAVYRRHDGGIWSSDNGAKHQYETGLTKINIYNYLGKKDAVACYKLADYVASNGFKKKITFQEYYRLIFTQLSFFDAFKLKNKYLLFPWIYFVLKKRKN